MIAKSRKFKKGSRQTIFLSTLIGCLVIFTIGFLVFSNLKISQKRAEYKAQIEALQEKIQILKEKNEELKTGISQAGSKEHLEKVALEQLGLKPPGTEVVVITKEKEEEKKVEERKRGFWNPQTWWEWLKSQIE